MGKLLIYTPKRTNRLVYVLDWLFVEQLKTGYRLTHDESEAKGAAFVICYGAFLENACNIPDAGLLWETGIRQHDVLYDTWSELSVLYLTGVGNYRLPFDVFSAIFFLLSRYEEYYPYQPDKHGRYPATQSILSMHGLLERPIVDEWVNTLRTILNLEYKIATPQADFTFQPTYDIDIAWSYKNKGAYRIIGAAIKDVISGRMDDLFRRIKVLTGQDKDPYDGFDVLRRLHTGRSPKPIFFILASDKTTSFDKNIHPLNAEMKVLIQDLSKYGIIGMHPSYYTDKQPELNRKEKKTLEEIIGTSISLSRQHYIKIKLPETYRSLMASGIEEDYSMGYATHLGFRAGTGQSFFWYDLQAESSTALIVHPFCFMDTTARFEQQLSVQDAFEKLQIMTKNLKKANSRLITVFHNFSLGSASEWDGWKEAYEAIASEYLARTTS